jgi:hypothetical protein
MVELPVVALDNFGGDHQLKKPSETVDDRIAAEGLQDPDKLRHFEEGCRGELVDLHRKSVKNRRQDGITREP